MNLRKILLGIFKSEKKKAEENPSPAALSSERSPMDLRNGFRVTKAKDPTFAEQWVNILNYNGESQTEGENEETEEINAAGNLE